MNENLDENQSQSSLISNIFGMFGNKKEDKNKAIKKSNLKDIYPQKNVESFSIIPINKNKKKEIKLYSDKFRKLNIKPISKVQSFEIIHSYTKPQNQIEAYKFSILSQIDLMRSSLKDEQSEEDNKSKKSRKYSNRLTKSVHSEIEKDLIKFPILKTTISENEKFEIIKSNNEDKEEENIKKSLYKNIRNRNKTSGREKENINNKKDDKINDNKQNLFKKLKLDNSFKNISIIPSLKISKSKNIKLYKIKKFEFSIN